MHGVVSYRRILRIYVLAVINLHGHNADSVIKLC